jgi:hypothetical protein
MHHGVILKVWAEDKDSALQEALEALENSIDQSNNICGWDYVSEGNTYVIDDSLLSVHGVSSFKDLEKQQKKQRKDNLKDLIVDFENTIKPYLAEFLLTKRDAALCLQDETIRAVVEKRLKAKKDIAVPCFPDLVKKIVTTIVDLLEPVNLMYLTKKIDRLQRCIEEPLNLNRTLQSTDNGYAEIPCEDKKNKHPYFVFGDRHI